VKLKELTDLGVDEINVLHVQESYLRQSAHARPLTAKKKSKSEVRATGAKWYRQKGTGRARQGETTNPHLTGGGLAFPPHPRRPRKRLNKHVRRSALRSALLHHIRVGSASVVQGQDFLDIAKTKAVDAILKKIAGYESVCLVLPADVGVWLAARNLWNVRLTTPAGLCVRDLVECSQLVFAQAALDEFKQLLAAHSVAGVSSTAGATGGKTADDAQADPGGEE
jgi:large subunit ribosomal protein L4